jgi:replicative DNA helicase
MTAATRRALHSVPDTQQVLRIPANEAAERAVLGAVLADATCYPIVKKTIRATDFYNEQNRLVFEAFDQLAGNNRDIDLLTTTDQLERSGALALAGGVAYVASLAEGLPDPANIEHYAAILRDQAVRRSLLHLGQELVRDAADLTAPVQVTIAAAVEALTGLAAQLGGEATPNPNADVQAMDATALARASKQAELAFALLDRPDVRTRVAACRAETERRRGAR